MTVEELITKLQQFSPKKQVLVFYFESDDDGDEHNVEREIDFLTLPDDDTVRIHLGSFL